MTVTGIYGVMLGLETLSQMVIYNAEKDIFEVKNCPWLISDEPEFKHRGLLVDTARHYRSLHTLRDLIRSMSYAKLNVLHW